VTETWHLSTCYLISFSVESILLSTVRWTLHTLPYQLKRWRYHTAQRYVSTGGTEQDPSISHVSAGSQCLNMHTPSNWYEQTSILQCVKISLQDFRLSSRIWCHVVFQKIINIYGKRFGCEKWFLTLREEYRLRVFEDKVLRKIFGSKRDEVTGE
jgi:hypothetical protein